MKLFYYVSSCSLSPHIVLRELGLPFSLDYVDLATKKTSSGDDFTAINPKGYIPALQLDDGELLTEGMAITQHLVDTYAPGTLAPPSGTIERTRLNSWLTFLATELHKPFSPLFNPDASPEVHATAMAAVTRAFGLIEATLADGRRYLTGSDLTLADIYIFVLQNWAPMTGVDLAPYPHLVALAGRVADRPTVKAAMQAEVEQAGA